MPLTNIGLSAQATWSLQSGAATGYAAASQGDDLPWVLAGIDVAVWNQLYVATLSTAASGTATIDLTALSNLVGESFSFGHVLAIAVLPQTADVRMQPGGAHPIQWFFNNLAAGVVVHNGGVFVWSDPATSTGTAVTGTAKTFTVTNLSGTTAASTDLLILGSTT